jgi:enolase
MATFDVVDLSALEILDSRGRPTLAVTVRLADGPAARAGVPSGASTGSREAVERRDGDPDRYEGKGVLGAVAAVNTEIRDLLRGRPWTSLAEADQAMIDLDGTENKSRLGANATVGTSMALARALAASAGDTAVAVDHAGRRPALPAGAALQRAQRRHARPQRAGFPGIHGRPRRCALDGRSGPGGRRGVQRPAP